MVVILLRVASWIDLTGRGFVPPTQVVTLVSAPSLTAPEAPTANPPPEKPSGPGGMEGARDADDPGSNPGTGADFSSPSDEGKEPSADGSPGHLLQDSGAQETPLGLLETDDHPPPGLRRGVPEVGAAPGPTHLTQVASSPSARARGPASQSRSRLRQIPGWAAHPAHHPPPSTPPSTPIHPIHTPIQPRPTPASTHGAIPLSTTPHGCGHVAAVETRKPKELDRKVSTLQKVVIQGLRAKRQSMTVKQLLTAAARSEDPEPPRRLRAPPKESLPTKPGHLPGVYNSDSRSCAYAAMIHALAAVRMAAPGATETLLAGSEALDHIGRAVAQAMDPTPCRVQGERLPGLHVILQPLNETVQGFVKDNVASLVLKPLTDFQNFMIKFVAEDMGLEQLRSWILEMKDKAIDFINSGLDKLTSMVTGLSSPLSPLGTGLISSVRCSASCGILGGAAGENDLDPRHYQLRVAFGRRELTRLRGVLATVRTQVALYRELAANKVTQALTYLPAVSLDLQKSCYTLHQLVAAGVLAGGTTNSTVAANPATRSPSYMQPVDEVLAPVREKLTDLATLAGTFGPEVEEHLITPLTAGLKVVDEYRLNFTTVLRPALKTFLSSLNNLGPVSDVLEVLADPMKALDGIHAHPRLHLHLAVGKVKEIFEVVKGYAHLDSVSQVIGVINGVVGSSDKAKDELPKMIKGFLQSTGLGNFLKPLQPIFKSFSDVVRGATMSFLEFLEMIISKIKSAFSWLEFGNETPALAPYSQLAHCSSEVCLHPNKRSMDLDHDVLFLIKYLHFADLGRADGPQRGHARTSTWCRTSKADGGRLRVHPQRDGHLAVYSADDFWAARARGVAPEHITARAIHRLDISPGGSLALDNLDPSKPYLWAADAHEAGHSDSPAHHGPVDVRSRPLYSPALAPPSIGWMCGYQLNLDGSLKSTETYTYDGAAMLKPQKAHFIGTDVRGIGFVKQLGFSYVVLTRCFIRPGRCTLQFHNFTFEKTTARLPNGASIAGAGVFSKGSNMQSVGVPSGAEGMTVLPDGEDILIAFSSSCNDNYQTIKWSAGDNEDRLWIARVPILRSVKPTITANKIKLQIGTKIYFDAPAVPSDFKNDDQKLPGARDKPAAEKVSTKKEPKVFFKKEITFNIMGIPCFIGIEVSGAFKVGLKLDLNCQELTIAASVIPTMAFALAIEGGVELGFMKVGVGIKCTIMETSLIPEASVRFFMLPPSVCLKLDVEFIPLSVELYFFAIKICLNCDFWTFGMECWNEFCGKIQIPIFSFSLPKFTFNIFTICIPLLPAKGPGPGQLSASQTAEHTISAKWAFGDQDPQKGGNQRIKIHHYELCVGSTPGAEDLCKCTDMGTETSGTLDKRALPLTPMGSVVYATAVGVSMTKGRDRVTVPVLASDHIPQLDASMGWHYPKYFASLDTIEVRPAATAAPLLGQPDAFCPPPPSPARHFLGPLLTPSDILCFWWWAGVPVAGPDHQAGLAEDRHPAREGRPGQREALAGATRVVFDQLALAHGATYYLTMDHFTGYSVENYQMLPIKVDMTPPHIATAEGLPTETNKWYSTELLFRTHWTELAEPESEFKDRPTHPSFEVQVFAEFEGERILDMDHYPVVWPASGFWIGVPERSLPSGAVVHSQVLVRNWHDLVGESISPGQIYDPEPPVVRALLLLRLPTDLGEGEYDAQAQYSTDTLSTHFCVWDNQTGIEDISGGPEAGSHHICRTVTWEGLSLNVSAFYYVFLQAVNTQYPATWYGFQDNYFLKGDDLGLGTSCQEADVSPMTDVGTAYTATIQGLELEHARTYYAIVTAEDYMGNRVTSCSDGLLVDLTPPDCNATGLHFRAPDYDPADLAQGGLAHWTQASTEAVELEWNPCVDNETGVTRYELALGTVPMGTDVAPFTYQGNASTSWGGLYGLALEHGGRYYATLRSTNGVGLTTFRVLEIPVLVDTIAPVVSQVAFQMVPGDARARVAITPGTRDELTFFQSRESEVRLTWRIAEMESRVAAVRVLLGPRCDTFAGSFLTAAMEGPRDHQPVADYRPVNHTELVATNHTFTADMRLALSEPAVPGMRIFATVCVRSTVGCTCTPVPMLADATPPQEGLVMLGLEGRYMDYLPTARFVPVYWTRAVDLESGITEHRIELLTDSGAGAWARKLEWDRMEVDEPARLAALQNCSACCSASCGDALPAGSDPAVCANATAMAACPACECFSPEVVASAVWQSTAASDAYFFAGLNLADGYYRVRLTSTNPLLQSTTILAAWPVLVDTTPPTNGTVHLLPLGALSGGRDLRPPAANLTMWVRQPAALLKWTGVGDPESGLATVEIGLHEVSRERWGEQLEEAKSWNASSFQPTAWNYTRLGPDISAHALSGSCYIWVLRAINNAEMSSLSTSPVWCVDYTNPIVEMVTPDQGVPTVWQTNATGCAVALTVRAPYSGLAFVRVGLGTNPGLADVAPLDLVGDLSADLRQPTLAVAQPEQTFLFEMTPGTPYYPVVLAQSWAGATTLTVGSPFSGMLWAEAGICAVASAEQPGEADPLTGDLLAARRLGLAAQPAGAWSPELTGGWRMVWNSTSDASALQYAASWTDVPMSALQAVYLHVRCTNRAGLRSVAVAAVRVDATAPELVEAECGFGPTPARAIQCAADLGANDGSVRHFKSLIRSVQQAPASLWNKLQRPWPTHWNCSDPESGLDRVTLTAWYGPEGNRTVVGSDTQGLAMSAVLGDLIPAVRRADGTLHAQVECANPTGLSTRGPVMDLVVDSQPAPVLELQWRDADLVAAAHAAGSPVAAQQNLTHLCFTATFSRTTGCPPLAADSLWYLGTAPLAQDLLAAQPFPDRWLLQAFAGQRPVHCLTIPEAALQQGVARFYLTARVARGRPFGPLTAASLALTVDRTPVVIAAAPDARLLSSGLASSVQLSLGTQPGLADVVEWTEVLAAVEAGSRIVELPVALTLFDARADGALDFYPAIRVRNSAGLTSARNDSEPRQLRARRAGLVFEGTDERRAGLAYQASTEQLFAGWAGFQNNQWAVDYYQVALGTAAGLDDVVAWFNYSRADTVTFSGLSLAHGGRYHASVRAVFADPAQTVLEASGAGILVDTTPPVLANYTYTYPAALSTRRLTGVTVVASDPECVTQSCTTTTRCAVELVASNSTQCDGDADPEWDGTNSTALLLCANETASCLTNGTDCLNATLCANLTATATATAASCANVTTWVNVTVCRPQTTCGAPQQVDLTLHWALGAQPGQTNVMALQPLGPVSPLLDLPDEGVPLYPTFCARNGAGLTSCVSPTAPIWFDPLPPAEGRVVVVRSATACKLVRLTVAMGTQPGLDDLLAAAPVDPAHAVASLEDARQPLLLQPNLGALPAVASCYVTVEATNGVGLSRTVESGPLLVLPATLGATAQPRGLTLTLSAAPGPLEPLLLAEASTPCAQCQYRVVLLVLNASQPTVLFDGLQPAFARANGTTLAANTATRIPVAGLLADGQRYAARVRLLDASGRAGAAVDTVATPLLLDLSAPVCSLFTVGLEGFLPGARYIGSAAAVSVRIEAADPHSGVAKVALALGSTDGDTDLLPWRDLSAATSLAALPAPQYAASASVAAALSHQQIVWPMVVITNGKGLTTLVRAGPHLVDLTPPKAARIGELRATPRNLTGSVEVMPDPESRVALVEVAIATAPSGEPPVLGWQEVARNPSLAPAARTIPFALQAALVPGRARYYLFVRETNGAGLRSVASAGPLKPVWFGAQPAGGMQCAGLLAWNPRILGPVLVNWLPCDDAESDVAGYEVSLGSQTAAALYAPWTAASATTSAVLTEVYFSDTQSIPGALWAWVRCTNGVGLQTVYRSAAGSWVRPVDRESRLTTRAGALVASFSPANRTVQVQVPPFETPCPPLASNATLCLSPDPECQLASPALCQTVQLLTTTTTTDGAATAVRGFGLEVPVSPAATGNRHICLQVPTLGGPSVTLRTADPLALFTSPPQVGLVVGAQAAYSNLTDLSCRLAWRWGGFGDEGALGIEAYLFKTGAGSSDLFNGTLALGDGAAAVPALETDGTRGWSVVLANVTTATALYVTVTAVAPAGTASYAHPAGVFCMLPPARPYFYIGGLTGTDSIQATNASAANATAANSTAPAAEGQTAALSVTSNNATFYTADLAAPTTVLRYAPVTFRGANLLSAPREALEDLQARAIEAHRYLSHFELHIVQELLAWSRVASAQLGEPGTMAYALAAQASPFPLKFSWTRVCVCV
ncbi:hypothetical protein PAPYR_9337 [Paratrimastix pyriformis]|uniref:Uncharacterized protein n=1 Tax=Paratrimastix pyriformis TaxID=342808 RepID=A0ABQ8U8K7_9EUKA|nr:hypothetical protein PAPYR_9337 [Paratrimastix pyriformis]